jgi:hypothetical protein
MIIEIALGIVLAVLILAFLPAIIGIGAVLVLLAVGVVILYFFFSNFVEVITFIGVAALVVISIGLFGTFFGILLSKIPIANRLFFKEIYPLKKNSESSFFGYFKNLLDCYCIKGFFAMYPLGLIIILCIAINQLITN